MNDYDTLDDVELPEFGTLYDVYNAVLGKAMLHDDLVGVVTTGAIMTTHNHGNRSWGNLPAKWENHPEIWQCRSSPKGRIGMALKPEELREVVVLIREGGKSKRAMVTTIKLWRLPGLTSKLEMSKKEYNRGATTFGALGVPFHGILIFNERAVYREDTVLHRVSKSSRCHSILSGYATIMSVSGLTTDRVEASMVPHYVIAGHLAGFTVSDVPLMRSCQENFSYSEWGKIASVQRQNFAMEISKASEACRHERNPDFNIGYIFSAECICEQSSFIGLLDQLSDKFYEDAIPDDLHQPCGISLMLAIAVRIACNPRRWGLALPRGDDAYATKEASFLFEAVQPSVLPCGSDTLTGDQTYGIDLAITHACEAMSSTIHKLRVGQINGRTHDLNHTVLEARYHQTLNYLFCAGIAVCQDTCGLLPDKGDGTSGLYTECGFASWYSDAASESRAQSAYSYGLGAVHARMPTHRTSTRGRRQKALIGVLQNVEQWICTGKYRGVRLSQGQTMHANSDCVESIRAEDLDAPVATRTSNLNMHVAITDEPPQSPSTPSAPPTAAAHNPPRKKKGLRAPLPKDMNATLADNGKRRSANEQHCINQAVKSLLKKNPTLNKGSTARICNQQINGVALDDAVGVLSDHLQVGAVFGMSQQFDVQTYAVGSKSSIQCSNCPRTVNVVESIAFSGSLGNCRRCGHPRCLHCVSEDINIATVNAEFPGFLSEPSSSQLDSCLMCCRFTE